MNRVIIITIIVCLDDKNGMMFNGRRQSSDRVLREHIITVTKEDRLWMNEYSAEMFENADINIHPKFLMKANKGDFCFVENCFLEKYIQKIEKIIVYRWNKRYPADMYFDISLEDWKLSSSSDFIGNSHEKITEETYIK